MFSRTTRFAALMVVVLNSSACAHSLTPMQRRQITTQVVPGPYEDVYRATLTTLQDLGYQVERTDTESGLVRGQRRISESVGDGGGIGGALLGLALLIANEKWGNDDGEDHHGVEAAGPPTFNLSCVLTPLDDQRTEVRALLTDANGNVYHPDPYREIFTALRVEVERREAMGQARRDADAPDPRRELP